MLAWDSTRADSVQPNHDQESELLRSKRKHRLWLWLCLSYWRKKRDFVSILIRKYFPMSPILQFTPRSCQSIPRWLPSVQFTATSRYIHTTSPLCARKAKVRPPPTKAKLAAKERKKALKSKRSIYEQEKMPLSEAVNIIRVQRFSWFAFFIEN